MVAEKVLPSVVTVSTTTAVGVSVGSGNIIRDDGYILTNSHVVPTPGEGVATSVLLSDGSFTQRRSWAATRRRTWPW